MSKSIRCKRHGCLKHYTEEQNVQGSCHYHTGKPIFHDTKKGWTCCNKVVYDWDQFQKLPTCATGIHSDKKDEGQQFSKSITVKNAQNAIKKQEAKQVVIMDINKYNKEQAQKKKLEQSVKTEKKIFLTQSGKRRCINQGCLKQYTQQQNGQQACNYHKGAPVFHDLKKYWNCCGKETHDWDQFMKLPTCCKGWHSPKYQ